MTIGEKIRSARLARGKTQAEIADGKITRNMLSAIESDKALPSLETLFHIAAMLELPPSYILSDESDIFVHKKNELISEVRSALADKRYAYCISLVEKIGVVDDELAYILAYANFELGVSAAKFGSFITADKHLSLALEYADKTVYDTKSIKCKVPLYMAFVKNVNAPLLDFDRDAFIEDMSGTVDYEFFRYLCNDSDYHYKNVLFGKHIRAKTKIKERKYYDAIELLLEIAEAKSVFEYNAYLMYGVYGDLDNCYKQVCDFENAYKYAGKRISMLEGFNS